MTKKTTARKGRTRLQFSLQHVLVLLGATGIALAICVGVAKYVGDAEVRTQLREAREWKRTLPSDGKGYQFPVIAEGQWFTISNTTATYYPEIDIWAVNAKSKVLTRTLFVTPPGVEVGNVDEAFDLIRREAARAKQKTAANGPDKK